MYVLVLAIFLGEIQHLEWQNVFDLGMFLTSGDLEGQRSRSQNGLRLDLIYSKYSFRYDFDLKHNRDVLFMSFCLFHQRQFFGLKKSNFGCISDSKC